MTARTWRADGPGSFQHPAGVNAVTDRHGVLWTRRGPRWTSDGKRHKRWYWLTTNRDPLAERREP